MGAFLLSQIKTVALAVQNAYRVFFASVKADDLAARNTVVQLFLFKMRIYPQLAAYKQQSFNTDN